MSNEVLEAVRALLPGIAERARAVDEKGRVPVETIRELTAAGVFRMLQPTRHGGAEDDPVAFYEVVRAVSGACGSTGWVAAILGVHSWHLGLFPDEAQREVWGPGPDTLVASSYAPIGRLTPVDGGFEVSGRWSFSSGVEFASWALLGALLVGAEGRPVDFMTVLVPRRDYEIREVWDSMGLRGTASDDIVVETAFVPSHRAMRNIEQARLHIPGSEVNPGPLYRMPFGTVFTNTITAAVIGMAAGCHDHYVTLMRDRIRLSLGGGRFAEDQFAQVAVARAASEIDAAILQTDRNIREIHEYAARDEKIPMELRLRARRDQVRGTERAIEAIDILFKTAGGNSLHRGNVIERAWRDAHAGSVHVANDVDHALSMYGRGEFGLAVEDNLV
ncbi:3-hydroxy-9,10-secoandrosta-1,3,5(10)-triene-9,17-dione monooxygenase [Actinomadura pelletieri DSM 43383]|uniref:3-hydroxy-9,10-secoandrosta-1,3,5(10)-triene-9, 17-dione monooxygenase n=1 Tax=Actinomadura pelletieri DSM 43383 TaxID=1120940 RepID=A0A495QTX5_9ACTN|nr:3-hydroxy-9,10-secoandrosta-1,3,5(10)-triene-9,17-dione monooxygenase oxygenase subunit [Actinomadura pelletieri]RKS76905.1 3-hydroxy-9,10-secoandrosta-1,3,5(10)-triene-9,17-dione monooxygenase [Actinomadura pelletieri DSM 43383]